jgi:NADH:ubiquinone oxidoreductase subunit E
LYLAGFCYAKGVLGLLETLGRHRVKAGFASPEGSVSVNTARCMDACGLAPAIIFDGETVGRVKKEEPTGICILDR